ncbi:MAG TPA: MarR family transcriptional regulator [Methylomirabilota bacterium]|nr:MarR family transcriptional regulator [Methylomirabilota bacterium]
MTEEPNGAVWIDAETKVAEAPHDHRAELRLWLRLLTCTTLIETEVRRRLREEYDFTLPRFDLLAQLDKAEGGLVLGEVSKRLMVSAGNVTALVERLLESGHITRTPSPTARRVQIIRMTPAGRTAFREMAEDHADWIGGLFEGIGETEIEVLMASLGRLKSSVRAGIREGAGS